MNVQAIYSREYRDCARSPEWKAGALAGLHKAAGASGWPGAGFEAPYVSGTAQDDAWRFGFAEGYSEYRHAEERQARLS